MLQPAAAEKSFETEIIADLDHPWAMTFMPDGRLLVTEKAGSLLIVTQEGEVAATISGVPAVDFGGQGGLGDVIIAPDFAATGTIYLSYVEEGRRGRRGAAVAMATLDAAAGSLSNVEVIWRQEPKTTGRGHFGHRLAFSPDGQHLFISSGDRQKFNPAQSDRMNLGKILRLNPDGSIPEDNPFFDQGGVMAEVWTLGMRNPLGLAFDADGTLWEIEMGPLHGDEFQRIERGENYGYPIVSNGDHYSGREIPDHDTRPEFRAPDTYWVPAISPSSLMIYQSDVFPGWNGSALIGGLSSEALVRVAFDCEGETGPICEVERFAMDARIREVEQGPNGHVWLFEDGGEDGGEGRLLKLTPKE
ncbi:MAG: PQQ-dependent sugar dehydrogenase [Pseudomonadota bacterium]